jgi:hypothetical protein
MNHTATRLGSSESPPGFDRNRWLVSIGIDGCNGRNAHLGVRDGRHRVLVIESPWNRLQAAALDAHSEENRMSEANQDREEQVRRRA